MPSFLLEAQYEGAVVGIDEAGRGPLAGPVVAGAVYIPPDVQNMPFLEQVRDSKKLNAIRREALFTEITRYCAFGIAIATEDEIDSVNILQATFLAMNRSLDAIKLGFSLDVRAVLVDGNHRPKGMEGDFEVRPVVKGDDASYSIACASILAKVTRDRIMTELDLAYPHYGWASNAGYGTAEHMAGIHSHGVCKHHRRSFAPIRKAAGLV